MERRTAVQFRETAKEDYKINYREELNDSQLQAVEAAEGPVLVIAGAGSGKTRVLVYRVARLVEEGVEPERILLLTFTRKAAREMLSRASDILDQRCGKVSGGTFHSFANSVLRRYARFIGFSHDFTILDRSDAEDIISLVRTREGYSQKKVRFPQKKTILNVISRAANKGCTLEGVLEKDYPHFREYVEEIEKISKEFQNYKKVHYLMDYDDLLLYLKVLLAENNALRSRLSGYYRYLMIDEYQDTNKLQADIACLLASAHHNIMVVGDDSQSIYAFRGANFKNIMDFPRIFPQARIITMSQNYRSTQPILDFTNQIIASAREKYSKTLFSTMIGEQKPVLVETESEDLQSKFVVQRVLELREEGISLGEMAVLFRAGWHSHDLEIELTRHGIPFKKYGGFKFMETAHIKDVVAHLKVIFNPQDAVSWQRILLLLEGIGPKTADSITAGIVDQRKGPAFLKEKRFQQKKYSSPLEKLHDAISLVSGSDISPAEQVRMLVEYYRPFLEKKYDDFPKRLHDLESLMKIAARYSSLRKFLTDITLEPLETTQVGVVPGDKEEESLVLSTMHSAKGLEWHTVFLLFIVDGYLPSLYALENEEEIEEERRLLYVAATRARENLFVLKPGISYPARNYLESSYLGFSEISRFLREGNILEEYMDKRVLEY